MSMHPLLPGAEQRGIDDDLLGHGGPTPADAPAPVMLPITPSPPVYVQPQRASILLACTACGCAVPENLHDLHDAWHADERTAAVTLNEHGEPV